MTDYKELVERLRMIVPGYDGKRPIEWEAADAIENLLNDIHARKAVAEGLMYLNGQLALAAAEKSEDIRNLREENGRLNKENFWLSKGGQHMKTLAETVGENIRAKRTKAGLYQNQLADMIGAGNQTVISSWECAIRCPTAFFLCGLADVFGCSVDELLGRAHGCLETD